MCIWWQVLSIDGLETAEELGTAVSWTEKLKKHRQKG